MKLYNTLSRKIEEFEPIETKKVGMYSCGPTVYNNAHIGNLRTYIFVDLLKRSLLADGYDVNHVMNITDVDDKTIRGAEGKLEEFKALTKKFEDKFWKDNTDLNNIKPNTVTRATEYIDKMVVFIEDLVSKGYAYKASDNSVYFSIEKFSDYGKLANLDRENLKSGARVSQDEYDKENPADFVLWKAWDENDGEIFWESSLGKGRPGWHIECSVMSGDTLGDTIDIHVGGVDLIFPHHENEIAQSEAKTGKKFVNFWVHNEHLMVDGKKMSKSLNNFYTLDDIREKGFSPLDFRYFVLGAHYRSKLNFTWDALESAKNTRKRMAQYFAQKPEKPEVCENHLGLFMGKINNDLNTPEALSIIHELISDQTKPYDKKWATVKKIDDEILGLGLFETEDPTAEIKELAEKRKAARNNKDYSESDSLRSQADELGWSIEDLPNNEYRIVKK